MYLSQMDYLIGERIMGYKPFNSKRDINEKKTLNRVIWTNKKKERFHFNPSTSAEHSRKVAKKLIKQGYEFRLYADGQKWICSFTKDETHYGISDHDNESICRAAIKAMQLNI